MLSIDVKMRNVILITVILGLNNEYQTIRGKFSKWNNVDSLQQREHVPNIYMCCDRHNPNKGALKLNCQNLLPSLNNISHHLPHLLLGEQEKITRPQTHNKPFGLKSDNVIWCYDSHTSHLLLGSLQASINHNKLASKRKREREKKNNPLFKWKKKECNKTCGP